jgi:phosphonopyruvate decarboxylase
MDADDLTTVLGKEDLTFLTGVPCSYLGNLLACLNDGSHTSIKHIVATNEGEAAGIATGYHLVTKRVPIIYLQNSGLGNTVNPLTSLMDKEVYSIPSILFLSWRGEPGYPDEPQHVKMGRIMIDLLKDLDIPYEFAIDNVAETAQRIHKLKRLALREQKPVALIFRSDLIKKPNTSSPVVNSLLMKREEILRVILSKIDNSPIISTTGKTSREIFELREELKQPHQQDFMVVGSMGYASSIGFGISRHTRKNVYVVDGDGAVLMHMGNLATIGHYGPKNLIHIVIDNSSYESTGGQPTVSSTLKWEQIFKGSGYHTAHILHTKEQLTALRFDNLQGPCAIVIHAQTGSRSQLGRPTTTPVANKRAFMTFLSEES